MKVIKKIVVGFGAITLALAVIGGILVGLYNNELSPYLANPVSDIVSIKLLVISLGVAILFLILYYPPKTKEAK